MKFRVINPELLAIAYRDAGRIALRLATEFARALEPDLAGAHDRFVQHLDVFLLLEIRLDLRGSRPFLANPAEQRLQIGGRKRLGTRKRSAKAEKEGEAEKTFKHFQIV